MNLRRLFLILLLICQQGNSQVVRPEISNLVSEISNYGRLTSSHIGYSGQESPQYIRCMQLDSLATNEELILLVEDKSPVVRCAAFPALCNRDIEESTKVLIAHLSDKEIVPILSGCVGDDSTVADYFVSSYLYFLTEKDTVISEKKQIHKQNLDKLILENSSISLRYKTHLIKRLEQNKVNYALVRKISIEGKEPEAILALAKYHQKKDRSIIINAFKNDDLQIGAIRAIKEFPLKEFYNMATKAFEEEFAKNKHDYPKLRLLYQTLAQYPNEPKTLILFDKTFTAKSESKKTMEEYLWMAITKYPNSTFEAYKSRLTIDEKNMLLLEEMEID